MGKDINYSFIIPHKNCPELLQRCVDSIPKRDDVQIIVVDDNSEEEKKPLLKECDNLQVILLDKSQSKGAGRARNVGLKYAKGKWLLFPDSDDFYCKCIEKFLDTHIDDNCDIIYFNSKFIDGSTLNELPPLFFQKEIVQFDGTKKAIDTVRFHHNVPWTKMVSNEYLRSHNLYFEEVPNGNDILFSMMAGYYTNNIIVEKIPIYVYLKNSNSILTSKETVDSAMCRLIHLVKLNYFYDYINHPEWKHSIIKRIFKYIVLLGLPFLLKLFGCFFSLYHKRKEWVVLMSK